MKNSCKSILDFEFFKRRFRHWQEVFNLLDYEVYFQFKELDEQYACINWKFESKIAVASLSEKNDCFQEKMTFVELLQHIDKSAFHECLHLIHGWYYHTLGETNKGQCDQEDHKFIRIMENSVFDVMVCAEPVNPYELEVRSRNFSGKKKK